MADIWDEKPNLYSDKYKEESYYEEFLYDLYEKDLDVWLERLHCDFRTLEDYKRWWLELGELLREYLVDCNDSDIIFSQLKDWKEKAEKWDEFQDYVIVEFETEEGSTFLSDSKYTVKSMVDKDCLKKLEAIIELYNSYRYSSIDDHLQIKLGNILGPEKHD